MDSLRPRLTLDGQWQFWTDPGATLTPERVARFHDEGGQGSFRVNVPAPWQSQAEELRYYSGVGWYRRSVEIPPEWLAQGCILLGFGAADYLAQVWLNGELVGEHEGGYLPFVLDVTGAAQAGQNTLVVRIADSIDLFPEIPHGKQSWYGQLSGLWQPVWMENRSNTYIRSVRITPSGEQVDVDVRLNRPLAPGDMLDLEVFSPSGEQVARQTTHSLASSLAVAAPLLWDVDSPHLYTLRARLHTSRSGGAEPRAADGVEETFGFRTIETHQGQILLNKRPLYLRGALDQDYYPDLISTPPSLDYIEDQFRKAKEMGLNCLRVHIKVADPRYYQAADRVGLLVWTELPNWELLTPASMHRARETLNGMVERDWNHPSIIIWTIVNESWGVDLTDPEHCAWLSETFDELKRLDPTRLVVGNSPCYANFHIVTDVEDFHNYASIPDHYRKWRKWVRTFAGRPPWTYAYLYESHETWRKYLRNPWVRSPRSQAPLVRRRGDEPLLVSEFGNWGLPDVERLRACYGGREPWWFESGFERADGVVYPHGVEQRFRAYHLDQVFPSLSDLSRASQELQFLSLKYEIEQIRLQPGIQGYVITEFTDVHWESNGLLDMCRNPKVFYDRMAAVNHPDLIIPDWRRVTYWEGETCRLSLALSHYSGLDLHGSRLEWRLEDWDGLGGVLRNLNPAPAEVTSLGKIAFRVPAGAQAVKARLSLRLFDRQGSLVASNFQDLYFFPRLPARDNGARLFAEGELAESLAKLGYRLSPQMETADLVITEVMTDPLRSYIMGGGRVLWLAEERRALQTYLGEIKLLPRRGKAWQGDWANNLNWINRTKLFAGLPTQGLVDFAFADLTPDVILYGLKSLDFANDVHSGMFIGWLHKPVALVAERRMGQGRLLASTYRLKKLLTANPMAALMMEELISYLYNAKIDP